MTTASGQVGSLFVNLGLDSATFTEAMDKAQRDLRASTERMTKRVNGMTSSMAGDIRSALEGAAGNVPILGNAVGALGGVMGTVAVGGLAAFTLGLMKAREAMDWAAEITDQAALIGVSTEALQEYRFVADEAGVSIQDMEGGLKSLNVALGAMQTGVANKKTAKIFEALGITKADLEPMRDASDLLPLVADRIAKLGTTAQQAQIAEKLGIAGLLPLLQQGADGLNRMRQQARDLGLVISKETVESLDAAQRKAEVASQVIDTQLKVAFANLAPIITGVTQALADSTKGLADWLTEAKKAARLDGVYGSARIEAIQKGLRGKEADKYAQGALMQSLEMAAANEFLRNHSTPKKERKYPPDVASEMDKKSGKTTKALTESELFEKRLAALDAKYKAGKISLEAYRAEQDRLSDAYAKVLKATEPLYGFFRDEITVEPIQQATAEIDKMNAELEMTPGFLDPIKQKQQEIADEAAYIGMEMAYAFGDAIAKGEDFGESVTRILKNLLAQWLAMRAMGFLGIGEDGSLKKGGIADTIANAVGSTFGGFRANGGPVQAGKAYVVGERGAEVFRPNTSGSIVSNEALRMGGGGYAPSLNFSGVTTGQLMAEVSAALDRDRRRVLDQARRALPGQMGNLNKLGTTRA